MTAFNPGRGQPVMAEFIGTFFIVFCGCGAQMVAERFVGSLPPGGNAAAFGLAVAVMVYAVGHISGAHFNPAVTLGFAVAGNFPLRGVPAYWAAQCLGAVAAARMLGFLLPEGGGYGATVPSLPPFQATVWESLLAYLLMFVIMAVATDSRAAKQHAALAIGGTVMLCALVGGPVSGASMNPARSLGPAVASGNFAGLWIFLVGPFSGAAAGSLTYKWLRRDYGRPN